MTFARCETGLDGLWGSWRAAVNARKSYAARNPNQSGDCGAFAGVSHCGAPGFGHVFNPPKKNPETLVLGQTKARNGLSTLKIGGGGGGMLNQQPPQPTANRTNRRATDGVHMVSPYFEGA